MLATTRLSHLAPHKWFLAIPDWVRSGGGAILALIGLHKWVSSDFEGFLFKSIFHMIKYVLRWYSLLTG